MATRSHRFPAVVFSALMLALAPCSQQTVGVLDSAASGPSARPDVAAAPPSAAKEVSVRIVQLVENRIARRGRRMTPNEQQRVAAAILDTSAHYDVSPELVLAVIEIESGYNPHAVSPVGAMGLMQLMPRTGAEVAYRTGETWKGTSTLFEPEVNIRLGVAYLRELIDRYESVRVALAAYNWGPGSIDRRLRRGFGLPAEYPDMVLGAYARVSSAPIGS